MDDIPKVLATSYRLPATGYQHMFLGHLALGYAAKRWAPGVSLAVLLGAAQLADLLWPILLAAGIEHVRIAPGITAFTPLEFVSYPFSHSLVMLVLWGALSASLWARTRRVFILIALLVVSHWFLDVLMHLPDVPLYPGGPKFGFGLWNSIAITRAIELTMFGMGAWIYLRSTTARDNIGRWAALALVVCLSAGFIPLAPPPPSIKALWITALVLFGIVLSLAHWTDRHRTAR